jgi:hypothetical protein
MSSTVEERGAGSVVSGVYAEFGGERAETAVFTWGQRAIWKAIDSVAPNDHWLNIRRVVTVSARRPVDVDTVARAIGLLMTEHEALRTRVRMVDGEPHQDVGCGGRLLVEVDEIGADEPGAPTRRLGEINYPLEASWPVAEATEEMLRRLGNVPFAYDEQWPLRAGVLLVGGRVRHIVLVLSHVAVDGHAVEIIIGDLRLLLTRGALPARKRLQPLDLARRELGLARRADRAVDHWLSAYRLIPPGFFPEVGPAHAPPYHEAVVTSRALVPAVAHLAERHDVSTSTVVLAAVAAVLGAVTGHQTCGLLTIVGNRFQAGHEDIVAPMNQLGLFVLDVSDVDLSRPDSLHTIVPRTWHAALLAYRHAYYDQAGMDRAIEVAGRGGGHEIDPYCCFNDLRGGQPAPEPFDPVAMRASLTETTLEWRGKDTFNWRFYLELRSVPDALVLGLTADTRFLPPEAIESFVRELELFIVGAASPDTTERLHRTSFVLTEGPKS